MHWWASTAGVRCVWYDDSCLPARQCRILPRDHGRSIIAPSIRLSEHGRQIFQTMVLGRLRGAFSYRGTRTFLETSRAWSFARLDGNEPRHRADRSSASARLVVGSRGGRMDVRFVGRNVGNQHDRILIACRPWDSDMGTLMVARLHPGSRQWHRGLHA
jgi:hypothetical protein